jgi:hypothetical protein
MNSGHYLHEDAIAQRLKSRFPELLGGMTSVMVSLLAKSWQNDCRRWRLRWNDAMKGFRYSPTKIDLV